MNKKIKGIVFITVLLVGFSLDPGPSSIYGQEVNEASWVLVKTTVNPHNASITGTNELEEFRGSSWRNTFSKTSLTLSNHVVIEGVWMYDSQFEFTWDELPELLEPGDSIDLRMTGKASWSINETAFFTPANWVPVPIKCGGYIAHSARAYSDSPPDPLIVETGVADDPMAIIGPPCWKITEPPSREDTVLTREESKTFRLSVPAVIGFETFDETLTIYVEIGVRAVEWVYQPSTPQPRQPRFEVDPAEGEPGDTINATGIDFPLNSTVNITWDSPDGPRLNQTKTDSKGSFVAPIIIPTDADSGNHTVFARSGITVLSALVLVRKELCVSGYVNIRFLEGLPLRDVIVELWRVDTVQGGPDTFIGDSVTDERGFYRICSPQILIPSGPYYLRVHLTEFRPARAPMPADLGITIYDESTENSTDAILDTIFNVDFGEGGQLGVSNAAEYFTIRTEVDLDRNLWFTYVEDNPSTHIREDHAFDASIIYYHTHQAMRFYRDVLGVDLKFLAFERARALASAATDTPVWIYSEGDDAQTILDVGIFFVEGVSLWNSGNAPKNREYHEYSHWVMGQVYGEMPPLWSEALLDNIYVNDVTDRDVWGGGYSATLYPHPWYDRYNNLTSSDAWTEGFAEFMGLAIADHYRNVAYEPYWQDLLPTYIYTVALPYDSFPQMYNLELNWNAPLDEEYTVASILWDIYDPVNGTDHDNVSMSITDMWRLIKSKHRLPLYYNSTGDNLILNFTGDSFTYSMIPEIREDQEDSQWTRYPMEERHIYYLRDLYDVLVNATESDPLLSVEAIDEVFRAHREFINTFYVYDEYSLPPIIDENIILVEDNMSSITLNQSTPPARYWWSNGFEVTLNNTGWGSGYMVENSLDATGWLYIWTWIDAPEGIEISVVVEDWAGEWISRFTSHGKGFTEPYVSILAPEDSFAGEYGFLPNPYRNTPNYTRPEWHERFLGPRVSLARHIPIKKIGLLFHSPGSYKVNTGPIVLIRGYPWRPGMFQIMGIGDPGASPFRPYRRNKPAIPGAAVQLSIDEAPATLNVDMKYAPPYEDLSFKYSLNLTEKTSSVGMFIEPPIDSGENEIILSVEKEGYISSEPVSINGSYYWENLGKKAHVTEINVDLEAKPEDGLDDGPPPLPSSELVVREHVLCKNVDSSGEPTDLTSSFQPDEQVISWLSVADAQEGDTIYWLFTGPNSIEVDSELIIDWGGEGMYYSFFSLSDFDLKQTVGQWKVTVFVNQEEALVDHFEVAESGFETLMFFLILIVVGIIVVITIFMWSRRSKPVDKRKTKTITIQTEYCIRCGAKLDPQASFCSECGNKVEYKRELTA